MRLKLGLLDYRMGKYQSRVSTNLIRNVCLHIAPFLAYQFGYTKSLNTYSLIEFYNSL